MRILSFLKKFTKPRVGNQEELENIYYMRTPMGKVKIYKLGNGSYMYYRNHVKGNTGVDFKDARKTLSRNIFLSKEKATNSKTGCVSYFYGNLVITVRNDTIIYIKNRKGIYEYDENNIKYREILNKAMNINK